MIRLSPMIYGVIFFIKLIPLSKTSKSNKGKYFAQVDDEDYEELNKYNWSAYKNGNTLYALRLETLNGKSKSILLHRTILGLINEKDFCDHKDRNGLNNQKINLRKCTRSENQKNSKSRVNCSSKYLGVDWDKSRNKWRSQITINHKNKWLGRFYNEIDAAKAYDEAAKFHHKEFANLNFK